MLDKNPLPLAKMEAVRGDLRQKFRDAKPFPHAVIDDFFDPEILDALIAAFPGPDDADWIRFKDDQQIKLASKSERDIPIPIRSFLYFLNSSTFLEWLEFITGIDGLIPDPNFDGGGLHQIVRGGKLAIHADFNKHKRFDWDRRLNLLLYLNKDWQAAYGGDLELWNTDMSRCELKISPIFNRMVIFATTDTSWHGHPDPLMCPEGATRKSLALYYFSMGRPEEERSAEHSTLFRARPDEQFLRPSPVKAFVRDWTPPAVVRGAKKLIGGR